MPGHHSTTDQRQALRQVLVIVIALTAVGFLCAMRARAPADRTQLRIPVAELRSQAADFELLQRDMAAGHLPERFIREHARQLARDSSVSFDDLASLHSEQALDATHADAVRVGLDLQRELAGFEARPTPAPEPAGELRTSLAALEHGLGE